MTECNKCGCHNWNEITIWQCDNCESLHNDENGTKHENKLSTEIVNTIEAQEAEIKRLKETLERIAHYKEWKFNTIKTKDHIKWINEFVDMAQAALKNKGE